MPSPETADERTQEAEDREDKEVRRQMARTMDGGVVSRHHRVDPCDRSTGLFRLPAVQQHEGIY